MSSEKKAYPELDNESLTGPLLPYGCDPSDDESFRFPYDRKENDNGLDSIKKLSTEAGIIYVDPRASTVYRQLTSDSRPIEDRYELEKIS